MSTARLPKIGAAISAGALIAVATLLTGGSAQAAPTTAGQYCGVYAAGKGNTTIFVKQPPGCNDLNLVYVESNNPIRYLGYDDYGAQYLSGGTWISGSRGLKQINDGNCNPNTNAACIPLTNVAAGTSMRVLAALGGSDAIIHVNE